MYEVRVHDTEKFGFHHTPKHTACPVQSPAFNNV